jgi:hypothetical protein
MHRGVFRVLSFGPDGRVRNDRLLIVLRGMEHLGERLPEAGRDRWSRFVLHTVEREMPEPFFFTAPNHEAYNAAQPAQIELEAKLVVETPLFGTTATLFPPKEGTSRIVWPILPMRG